MEGFSQFLTAISNEYFTSKTHSSPNLDMDIEVIAKETINSALTEEIAEKACRQFVRVAPKKSRSIEGFLDDYVTGRRFHFYIDLRVIL